MEEPQIIIEPHHPEPWQVQGDHWIAISGQRAVPHQFWAIIVDPALPYLLRLEIQLAGEANVATVRNLVVSRRDDTYPFGPDVRTVGLRGINVRRYLRLAINAAARPILSAEQTTGIPTTFRVEGLSKDRVFGGGRVTSVEGRGSRVQPDRLDLVADAYKAAKAEGRPVREAIMKVCHVEASQAQRLIRAARQAGKIPPR